VTQAPSTPASGAPSGAPAGSATGGIQRTTAASATGEAHGARAASGTGDARGAAEGGLVTGPDSNPGPTATRTAPSRRSRLPWLVALGAYAVLVAAVVGWPTPVDANARAPLSELFALLYGYGVPDWFDYAVLEKAANVAMFVPFGLLITLMDRRLWLWGIVGPGAASGAAELAQHVLLPERFATWTDVAANTAGAALGVALALAFTARGRAASRASRRRP
jgi:VanZ family protein